MMHNRIELVLRALAEAVADGYLTADEFQDIIERIAADYERPLAEVIAEFDRAADRVLRARGVLPEAA